MRVSSFVPSESIFQSNNSTNDVSNSNAIGSFSDVLKQSLDSVNDKQIEADNMNESFVKGDDVEISDVMLAGEEAKISLQFAVQVRNKLLDAYKEISQMQL